MAGRHDASFPIDHRAAERMDRRADQLAHRAGIDDRVRVERQDKVRLCKSAFITVHAQLALTAAQKRGKRAERAALALAAGPAPAVKAARTGKEKEAAVVLFVERVDRLLRRGQDLPIVRVCLLGGCGQVGKQPKAERAALSLPAAGIIQPLELSRRFFRVLFPGKEGRDHAHGLSLGRDAAGEIHARHAPGADQAREDKVRETRHRLADRQKQQQRADCTEPVEREQHQRGRECRLSGDIRLALPFSVFRKEEKADVSPLALGALDQCAGQALFVRFLRRGHARKLPEIAFLRQRVHARIFARGVKLKNQPGNVDAGGERVEIHQRNGAQRGKERREKLRVPRLRAVFALSGAAHRPHDLRDRRDDRTAQHCAERLKLVLAQDAHGLKAVEEGKQPLLRQLSPAGAEQRAAEREGKAVPAAAAQRRAVLEQFKGGFALALDQIHVVRQPFLRAGERLARLGFFPQHRQETPQLAPLAPQPRDLCAHRALSVESEQLGRRGRIGDELRTLQFQSG